MKKLLSLIIISLFVMSGLVFADTSGAVASYNSYTYENVTILGGEMGPAGQTPPIEAIRVTVGSEDDSIAVGDVMAWSIQPQITDGNALGFFVEKCRRSMSEDPSITEAGHGPYAGVMITVAASNDTGGGGGWANATPTRPMSSMGFMAIRGYCDAKVQDSLATRGGHLVLIGNDQAGYFGCAENISKNNNHVSEDIGYLLEDTDADGLMKVWLR